MLLYYGCCSAQETKDLSVAPIGTEGERSKPLSQPETIALPSSPADGSFLNTQRPECTRQPRCLFYERNKPDRNVSFHFVTCHSGGQLQRRPADHMGNGSLTSWYTHRSSSEGDPAISTRLAQRQKQNVNFVASKGFRDMNLLHGVPHEDRKDPKHVPLAQRIRCPHIFLGLLSAVRRRKEPLLVHAYYRDRSSLFSSPTAEK